MQPKDGLIISSDHSFKHFICVKSHLDDHNYKYTLIEILNLDYQCKTINPQASMKPWGRAIKKSRKRHFQNIHAYSIKHNVFRQHLFDKPLNPNVV